MDAVLADKRARLEAGLTGLGSVLVAFSGGVDSSLLLHEAHRVLGDKVVAVTASSQLFPARELDDARAVAAAIGARHIVLEHDALAVPGVSGNPTDRCYLCKRALFSRFAQLAADEGLACVADGSNVDDAGDYRPGMRAVAELGVKSPLADAGFGKADIRALSREAGLAVWDKPSAACLASRIPFGQALSVDRLQRVDAAEQVLRALGFAQVRVRDIDGAARIEVDADKVSKLLEPGLFSVVAGKLAALGYSAVEADPRGYRTGSLNPQS